MTHRHTWSRRVVAALLVGLAAFGSAAPALAIGRPPEPGGAPPPDGPPGPEYPTTQNKACQTAGVLPNSDLSQPPPATLALNLPQAWALSQGAGVTVAVIDTGVHPNSRLPTLASGGDYLSAGGDGLNDCDAHGTLIAGIIAASAAAGDGFEGVAPQARVLSIRWRSGAFSAQLPNNADSSAQTALDLRTLARAIVHAANLGAGVIDIPLPVCIDATHPIGQTLLASAVDYAVHVRGALIVAGAGDANQGGCQQNPDVDPTRADDPRNWDGVKTIATPAWFSPDVLAVGYTAANGTATSNSLAGPWVSIAAPGTAIESLDPSGGGVVNGVGAPGQLTPVGGASYASAYVSGVAALLRARFPNETPAEISARLQASAHQPARGVDNSVGAGVIDPVAALSYLTAPKPPSNLYLSAPLTMPTPARPKDWLPTAVATAVIVLAMLGGAVFVYSTTTAARRRR